MSDYSLWERLQHESSFRRRCFIGIAYTVVVLMLGVIVGLALGPTSDQLSKDQLSKKLKACQQALRQAQQSVSMLPASLKTNQLKELQNGSKAYISTLKKTGHLGAAELMEWFVGQWESVLQQPQGGDRLTRRAKLLSSLLGAMAENVDPNDFIAWQLELRRQAWLFGYNQPVSGAAYPAPSKHSNPRDSFANTSACQIAMVLNQTVRNVNIVISPTFSCSPSAHLMSVFLSAQTLGQAVDQFVADLRRQGIAVAESKVDGQRLITIGAHPGKK